MIVDEMDVDRMSVCDSNEDPILGGSYLGIVSFSTGGEIIVSVEEVNSILFEDSFHSEFVDAESRITNCGVST